MLVVTRQGSLITVSIDGEVVLRQRDLSPLPGKTRVSIGGFLSRVYMGEVFITKLEGDPIVAKGDPKKPKADPKKDPKTDVVKPKCDRSIRRVGAAVQDLVVGGGGRFLIMHHAAHKKLAVFDTHKGEIVHYVPLAEEKVLFAAGKDHLMILYPKTRLLQRF